MISYQVLRQMVRMFPDVLCRIVSNCEPNIYGSLCLDGNGCNRCCEFGSEKQFEMTVILSVGSLSELSVPTRESKRIRWISLGCCACHSRILRERGARVNGF